VPDHDDGVNHPRDPQQQGKKEVEQCRKRLAAEQHRHRRQQDCQQIEHRFHLPEMNDGESTTGTGGSDYKPPGKRHPFAGGLTAFAWAADTGVLSGSITCSTRSPTATKLAVSL